MRPATVLIFITVVCQWCPCSSRSVSSDQWTSGGDEETPSLSDWTHDNKQPTANKDTKDNWLEGATQEDTKSEVADNEEDDDKEEKDVVVGENDSEDVSIFKHHLYDPTSILAVKAVNASNLLGANFYAVLAKIYPNFVFSPLTISVLMALIVRGADGNTLTELFEAMRYRQAGLTAISDVQSAFHILSHVYLSDRDDNTTGFKSEIGNSMWVSDGKKINTAYLADAQKYFHTKLAGVNYKLGSQRSQSIINKWVDERNSGHEMTCSVSKTPFGIDTQLVFVNTFFFSARWGDEFQYALETLGNFYAFGTNRITAKFLQATTVLPHYKSEKCQTSFVEIPLKTAENKYSMVIVVPDKNYTISEVENQPGGPLVEVMTALPLMEKTLINLMLPKHVAADTLRLDRLLQILGVRALFHPDRAELTYMSSYDRLSVDRVLHEAVFEFKELGNTGDSLDDGRAQQEANLAKDWADGDIKQVFVNRPFIYVIVDKVMNAALFMGRVSSV